MNSRRDDGRGVIAVVIMLVASRPLARFVNAHPTVVVLCLGFLLMISFRWSPRAWLSRWGYLLCERPVSVLIELLNQITLPSWRRSGPGAPCLACGRAVLRLLGKQLPDQEVAPTGPAGDLPALTFGVEEPQYGQRSTDAGRTLHSFHHDTAYGGLLGES